MTRAILEYSISSFYKNEHVWPTYFKDLFISHWLKGLLQNTAFENPEIDYRFALKRRRGGGGALIASHFQGYALYLKSTKAEHVYFRKSYKSEFF